MMRAYSELYVAEAQLKLGSMLDYAVNGHSCSLSAFYSAFISCSLAELFGRGNPSVLAGRSGIELALEVLGDESSDGAEFTPLNGASVEYWTGWALAYYQWGSGWSFWEIEQRVPIDIIYNLYQPYHEMDISSFCMIMDELMEKTHPGTRLQQRRVAAGLSQAQLSVATGIPLRSIQQYEQRQKNIDKAQAQYLVQFARVLHCEVSDLMEHTDTSYYEYACVNMR